MTTDVQGMVAWPPSRPIAAAALSRTSPHAFPSHSHRAWYPRALWFLALTTTAGIAISLGRLVGPAVDWQAGIRNLLLYTSLTVATVSLAGPALAWLPPVVLTTVCMFFGHPPSEPGYYWWAAIMEEATTPGQWTWTSILFLCTTLLLMLRPLAASHVGRFNPGSAVPNRKQRLMVPEGDR
ncbi:hypothetical protein ACFVIY_38245 [Streptomyces sp. NPDC127166]|uniref:hypothetical protein n=1 Tax=Streptomyces sp. NPDC127166 TaxID=3345380 RepID=UPI00364329C7